MLVRGFTAELSVQEMWHMQCLNAYPKAVRSKLTIKIAERNHEREQYDASYTERGFSYVERYRIVVT
jgi:hypothetical protein